MNAKELLDKYIKYNSKITFDIFKLMYQKLIDLNFTTPCKVEDAFEEFSGRYEYFLMKLYDDKLYFNQYGNVTSLQSEISVEDLLGYNPFKNLELPEKWCIKVTKENQKILSKWRTDGSCSIGYYLLSPYHSYSNGSKGKIGYAVPNIPEDTIEITFDQFKQYVLKEPIVTKPPKPLPSRWCIKLDKTTIPIVGNYYNKKNLKDPNCVTYTACAEGEYVRSHNSKGEYVKNGYTACSFFNTPSDEYPEITLEDFKQFVMEETTNKTEEVVPEYVECFYSGTYTFIINKIYKCEPLSKADALTLNSEKGSIISNLPYEGSLWKFKPSTKEAFEAQNKPQSIEKWEKGSYVVCVQDYSTHFKVGDIGQIENVNSYKNNYIDISKSVGKACFPFKANCKWFATKSEAEEFSKTLVKSDENTIEYEKCLYTHDVLIDKPKQLLRQAVHCRTQEEWDFACDKYGKSSKTKKDFPTFNTFDYTHKFVGWYTLERYVEDGYEIISFQEWCDLIRYKYIPTLQTSEICTYGLNVGDELDETIINAWDKKGLNYWAGSSDGWIFGNSVPYYGDRKIENFKVIDGVVGFLVSGTHNIYLRAEGFKEFAENYNKSKESEVKFETDKWYKVYDGNVELYKGIWYVKSPKIIDGIVKVDQYLYNDCLGEGGNFGNVGDYTFVEVPLSEIQHLLAKCPSDKIEEATQNVVKVNTCKVRITSSEIKLLKI